MSLFIETIKIENGELQHLDLHLQRIQRTCREFFGSTKDLHTLRHDFRVAVREKDSIQKLTIHYDLETHHVISQPYYVKKIKQLYLVANETLNYHLKHANRKIFNEYSTQAGPEGDVLIIQQGRLTDATYANLALWNGFEWHTPSRPLLKGIKRQHLLESRRIKEKDILLTDLKKYKKISLINAMLELGETELATSQLFPFAAKQ